MDPSRYVELFVSESRERISAINRHLLAVESGEGRAAAVEEVFRSVHTLKGMAAAMGYTRSAALAHALEHLLEQLRTGALAADQEITDALFDAVDELERSIAADVEGGPGGAADEVLERLAGLRAGLEAAGEVGEVLGAPAAGVRARKVGRAEGRRDAGGSGEQSDEPQDTSVTRYTITLMVSSAASLPAVRAVLALKRARQLGEVDRVDPPEERLNAGHFSGKLAFSLASEREADEIRESLLGTGDIAHVLVEEDTRGRGEEEASVSRGARGAFVRVSERRLDQLVDHVAELVIARDALRNAAAGFDDPTLTGSVDRVSRLAAELRDEIMHLRMVPIGDAFDRFPRLVRDAARKLGRQVRFSVTGRHLAMDRSLLNEVGDLLVHLLRNAVDHGIEPPEEREGLGKPATGEVRLAAWREGSQAVIRVSDDGRGIDRERVTNAAIRLGLIDRRTARQIPDEELFAFLARPGFSTAGKVTEISGRGVGLDVVATRLQALGGTLEIRAEAGEGTAFTLKLPLSLAIIRCLHVGIGGDAYMIPLTAVREVVEVSEIEVRGDGAAERILLRDEEEIPIARVRDQLGYPVDPTAGFSLGPLSIVVVDTSEGVFGLVVDELVGQHESVLKPFDPALGTLPLFAGAALLHDGRPALVLDVNRAAITAADMARSGEIIQTADIT